MTWSVANGLLYLPAPFASAISSYPNAASNNGTVLVGFNQDVNDVDTAWRYTATSGYQYIGPSGFASSSATGVSGDGNTVLGTANNGNQYSDFVWTKGNVTVLPDSGAGALISADGSTIVGESSAPNHFTQAFTWTKPGGLQFWNSLPNTDNISVSAISADGSRVFGSADDLSSSSFVYKYTAGVMTSLGAPALIDPSTIFAPAGVGVYGASDDGSVLVGTEVGINKVSYLPTEVSWVWTAGTGYIALADYLAAEEVDLGNETNLSIDGISQDGQTLYGSGLQDGIQPSTWVAVVPEPSSLLMVAGGVILASAGRTRKADGERTSALGYSVCDVN